MQIYFFRNSFFLASFLMACIFTNQTIAQENHLKLYQYISPIPGSKLNLPETEIIIREGNEINRASIYGGGKIEVIGSKSGRHKGEIKLAGDSRTLIFSPANKFDLGEEVRVIFSGKIATKEGSELVSIEFNFFIANHPHQIIRKKVCEREIDLIQFKTESKLSIQY